jgi:NDP-sugar pyrophosphorylase family protein
MLQPEDFFDLSRCPFVNLFSEIDHVWEALARIRPFILENIRPNVSAIRGGSPLVGRTVVLHEGRLLESGFSLEPGDRAKNRIRVEKDGKILEDASVVYAGAVLMDNDIQIGRGTVVEPGALIKGPTIIHDQTEIRQGAYIRGDVLVGHRCVVGHATEMKNAVMTGESKAGHFAYIGDSLLGKVNLGAGTKLANLKIVDTQVVLSIQGKKYKTGLKKFGAVLGDGVETGCNSVTSPGTLLARDVLVYPNTNVKGYHPSQTIIKLKQNQRLQDAGK